MTIPIRGVNKQLLAVVISLSVTVGPSIAETIKGPCTLAYDKGGKTVSKHIEFGSDVTGKCDFKLTDFAGSLAIIANGEFLNTGDKALGFAYYVSFFDKDDNLVGNASFVYAGKASSLGSGKSIRSGSCIIKIPDTFGDKVASYQVAFYELRPKEQ